MSYSGRWGVQQDAIAEETPHITASYNFFGITGYIDYPLANPNLTQAPYSPLYSDYWEQYPSRAQVENNTKVYVVSTDYQPVFRFTLLTESRVILEIVDLSGGQEYDNSEIFPAGTHDFSGWNPSSVDEYFYTLTAEDSNGSSLNNNIIDHFWFLEEETGLPKPIGGIE